MTVHRIVPSPVGDLWLVGDGIILEKLWFDKPTDVGELQNDAFAPIVDQLQRYFDGERITFDAPLKLVGTPFQQRVWAALQEIPYGETIAYGTLAKRLGDPKLVRAVGTANGRNPVGIIVPCHRVIGASGDLVGFAGGLHRKRWLLQREGAQGGLF